MTSASSRSRSAATWIAKPVPAGSVDAATRSRRPQQAVAWRVAPRADAVQRGVVPYGAVRRRRQVRSRRRQAQAHRLLQLLRRGFGRREPFGVTEFLAGSHRRCRRRPGSPTPAPAVARRHSPRPPRPGSPRWANTPRPTCTPNRKITDRDDHSGHEHKNELLPAQLNFAKCVVLGRCHQCKSGKNFTTAHRPAWP